MDSKPADKGSYGFDPDPLPPLDILLGKQNIINGVEKYIAKVVITEDLWYLSMTFVIFKQTVEN